MDREHYASLEQLAPGDRIWLDGAWRTVYRTYPQRDGEIQVVVRNIVPMTPHLGFTAPAALLVRRAER
jgi:hypothetical protein